MQKKAFELREKRIGLVNASKKMFAYRKSRNYWRNKNIKHETSWSLCELLSILIHNLYPGVRSWKIGQRPHFWQISQLRTFVHFCLFTLTSFFESPTSSLTKRNINDVFLIKIGILPEIGHWNGLLRTHFRLMKWICFRKIWSTTARTVLAKLLITNFAEDFICL